MPPSMPRFFVERIADPVVLSTAESRHAVRSLRLSPGAKVTVFDPREAWAGEILSVEGRVRVRLLERLPGAELPRVVVAAAVPKGNRLDWMVEKLAELGVAEFIPVRCARSVAALGEGKRRRLEKIAVAAAKQSGSPLMAVSPERGVAELPADAVLLTPSATRPLEAGPGTVVVGPEGGFTAEEEGRFPSRRSLGRTTLRVETAALAAAVRLLS